MKVFHYIDPKVWDEIKRDAKFHKREPALNPRLRMGREDPRAWEVGGLYGLLAPEPKEWTENKDFPNVWTHLMNDVGLMLVEMELNENDPDVSVVDWSHREYFLERDEAKKPEATRLNAESAYYDSKIPLKDYLARKGVLNYSLPEVVITRDVPFSDITVSEQQPHLEGELAKYTGGKFREEILRQIHMVPELKTWYTKFREHREGYEGQVERRR